MTQSVTLCPACALDELLPCADLGAFPATCGVTWAEPPVDPPTGPMTLAYCPNCAHVVNTSFDPAIRAADGRFDNSMLSSKSYRAHVASVAARLGTPTRTLELGCGEGELLALLPGQRAGWGHVPKPVTSATLTLRPAPWTAGEGESYDLVVARHVLEHVADPFALLRELRGVLDGTGYFEVPDAGYDLGTAGWDVIYPHASYFHAGSLIAMCERAGFTVTNYGLTFHDQYLYVEVSTVSDALPVESENLPFSEIAEGCAGSQLELVRTFGQRFAGLIETWRSVVAERRHPALWGAGARGLTFLGTVDPERRMAVVDLNQGKHGRYLPTGHRVDAPASLSPVTDAVIITNPAYEHEITLHLKRLGIAAEVLVA